MSPPDLTAMLAAYTETRREDWRGQYQARRAQYLRQTGCDLAVLNAQTSRWFEERWSNLESRLAIAHGKDTLTALTNRLQATFQVSLSPRRIVESMLIGDVPADMLELLATLERFRHNKAAAP